ncbi:DUF350 domain-containing protein [Opitutus sp. ER46]|uniref:DUF350 domain-containing protein n=1 Tax=Opitutus sp. ER46 TaxID=2161864 RepID=UPI000D2F5545|nr:DUF350 domain-containing protein [Opitutus sp. ER46]PTX95488.1 DUF350 domain-containing protein [Opitutus sp. ER46]
MQSLPLILSRPAFAAWLPGIGGSLLSMAVFALVGVLLAVVGYKIFDYCTPGDLHQEIVKNRNVAAAIVGAAIILGVCLIVAAAIVG